MLCREIEQSSGRHEWAQAPVGTAYFGGGTPSLHSPKEIAQVLRTAEGVWEFSSGIETTLEANPGTLNQGEIEKLREAGVNRLSVGAQSFSERKLNLLYRDHSAQEIRDCVEVARQVGMDNVSLDLIFGIPGETLEELTEDLREVLSLDPEHISLYNLEFHEKTPFGKWKAEKKLRPLDSDLEADMFLFIHEKLTAAGYEHYEVSNFAKPGFRSKHNSVYWEGKPFLGFGPSAHSLGGGKRFANIANTDTYLRRIHAGESAVDREWINSPEEEIEEWISLKLRKADGLIWSDFTARFGNEFSTRLSQVISELPAGLCEANKSHLRLTPRGWFMENEILTFIFQKLHPKVRSPLSPS